VAVHEWGGDDGGMDEAAAVAQTEADEYELYDEHAGEACGGVIVEVVLLLEPQLVAGAVNQYLLRLCLLRIHYSHQCLLEN